MEIQHSAVIEYIVRRRFPKPVSQSHENDLMIFMNQGDRSSSFQVIAHARTDAQPEQQQKTWVVHGVVFPIIFS